MYFQLPVLSGMEVVFVVLLGVLHTGVAYTLFFSLYEHLDSVEIVSYSYLEPLFAILFSVIVVGERLTVLQIGGGLLILGFDIHRRNSKRSETVYAK